MARLNMTVEGETEQAFADRLMKDHLANYNVFLGKPRLTAHAKKKGQVHRGGLQKYEVFKKDLCEWLKQDRSPDVYFTTMVDLYGFPRDCPSYDETARIPDPYQRVAALENALSKDIGDTRFIPYIQLHEFEALLLSDPNAFLFHYPETATQVENLKQLCARHHDSPERIDDGQQTAPSKQIGREIPRYLDEKTTAAPQIAKRIGIELMRRKCPHFDQWLRRLEGLGTSTPSNNK